MIKMKTTKTYLFLLTFTISLVMKAQESNEILQVKYTTNSVSEFLVNMLKKQIQDPDEYNKVMQLMSEYKNYNTLYYDKKSKESLYVLDSIHKIPGVSVSGYTEFIKKDADGSLKGKEVFMESEFSFTGNSKDLKWTITSEKKDIEGYSCTKAILENMPGLYVWFTTEIAIDAGPYIFYGLPGLVLEANSFFQNVSVTSVSYTQKSEFNSMFEKDKFNLNEKAYSLEEIFVRKKNFKNKVEKGK